MQQCLGARRGCVSGSRGRVVLRAPLGCVTGLRCPLGRSSEALGWVARGVNVVYWRCLDASVACGGCWGECPPGTGHGRSALRSSPHVPDEPCCCGPVPVPQSCRENTPPNSHRRYVGGWCQVRKAMRPGHGRYVGGWCLGRKAMRHSTADRLVVCRGENGVPAAVRGCENQAAERSVCSFEPLLAARTDADVLAVFERAASPLNVNIPTASSNASTWLRSD